MTCEIHASVFALTTVSYRAKVFEIFVRDIGGIPYSGILPEDIKEINVIKPNGLLMYKKEDFSFINAHQQFYLQEEGIPEEGVYTFNVTIGNEIKQEKKVQGAVIEIPKAISMLPKNLVSFPSGKINFLWNFESKGFYHRIKLKSIDNTSVIFSERILDANSAKVNLSPGHYLWQLETSDGPKRFLTNNCRDSEKRLLRITE